MSHEHIHQKRAAAEVTVGELQMLQSEFNTFHTWMTAWFDSSSSIDRASSVAQLKQEFQAYDGWLNAWLDSALGTNQPPPPPLPSTLPLPSSSKAQAPKPVTSAGSQPSHSKPVQPTTMLTVSSPANVPTHHETPSPSSQGNTQPSPPAVSPPSSSSAYTAPAPAPPASSSTAAAPAPSPSSGSGGGPSGGFDPKGSNNLAVYYGQTPATAQVTLSQLCQNDEVNIVVLAFLSTFFGPGGYPTVNFGSACSSSNSAQQAKGATGLLSCPDLAKEIQGCQSAGKAVLLSLGGADATTAFTSDDQAKTFATQLWNLFGDGTEDSDLRPFGDVKIDGFDIDNEDHNTDHYTALVSQLSSSFKSSGASKKYFISAAPQCPRPDASIPLDAMKMMDFIFVQFYNNGDCDVGQSGFLSALKGWSSDLANSPAKVFIGAPACSSCAGQGYLDAAELAGVVASAQGIDNLGGVMLWDGSEAMQNGGFLGGLSKALA